ncbi:hypothetical protein [Nakamurella leprariae]|nr:hypothetical protein [Nakamurella leprariae]
MHEAIDRAFAIKYHRQGGTTRHGRLVDTVVGPDEVGVTLRLDPAS